MCHMLIIHQVNTQKCLLGSCLLACIFLAYYLYINTLTPFHIENYAIKWGILPTNCSFQNKFLNNWSPLAGVALMLLLPSSYTSQFMTLLLKTLFTAPLSACNELQFHSKMDFDYIMGRHALFVVFLHLSYLISFIIKK